jgi:hypothetical protein
MQIRNPGWKKFGSGINTRIHNTGLKSGQNRRTLIWNYAQIGEEFEETTADGRAVNALVTLDGNKFISVQKAKKETEKSTKVNHEADGDKLQHIYECHVNCRSYNAESRPVFFSNPFKTEEYSV